MLYTSDAFAVLCYLDLKFKKNMKEKTKDVNFLNCKFLNFIQHALFSFLYNVEINVKVIVIDSWITSRIVKGEI